MRRESTVCAVVVELTVSAVGGSTNYTELRVRPPSPCITLQCAGSRTLRGGKAIHYSELDVEV